MKTSLRLLLMIFVCKASYAQIAIRGYYYQPLYDFGFFMKPTASLEIGYLPDFKERHIRINASFTYLKLNPKQSAFQNYATKELTIGGPYNYDEFKYIRRYQNYEIYQVFFGWDFAVIKKDRFQVYLGPGITAGEVRDAHTDLDENGNPPSRGLLYYLFVHKKTLFTGLRHHVGAQFNINPRLNIFANVQTCYWFNRQGFGVLNQANDAGIGIQYLFGRENKE